MDYKNRKEPDVFKPMVDAALLDWMESIAATAEEKASD